MKSFVRVGHCIQFVSILHCSLKQHREYGNIQCSIILVQNGNDIHPHKVMVIIIPNKEIPNRKSVQLWPVFNEGFKFYVLFPRDLGPTCTIFWKNLFQQHKENFQGHVKTSSSEVVPLTNPPFNFWMSASIGILTSLTGNIWHNGMWSSTSERRLFYMRHQKKFHE